MKQTINLSIDEKVLEMAKDNIPNKSQFVEDCFKAYLSFLIENEEERGEELRQAWNDFHRAKLTIHLLTKVNYEEKDIERVKNEQKTDAWLNCWADYRKIGSTQDYKIEETSKKLNLETNVLKQLLHDTYREALKDMSKLYIFDNWSYIEENILPYVEVDDEEEDVWDEILNG